MNAIILAAGEASRLGLTNIQKCMLGFGNKLAIDLLIDKLPPVDEICVCVGDDFRASLLENYLVNKYDSIKFRFVVQTETIGTANGVYLCLINSGYDDVIITWSDIIPKNKLPIPDKSTIFTSDNAVMRFVSRYRVDESGIRPTIGDIGNIMGLFFLKDATKLLPLLEANQTVDFVDVLQLSREDFNRYDIDFYDFGTEESFKVAAIDLSTSSHATLVVDGDKIIKKYDEEDRDLFEVESLWYKCASKEVLPFIPKIYDISDLTIVMERLDGHNIKEIGSERLARDFLARVVYLLDEYFHCAKYPSNPDLIYSEYIKKPLDRCEFVSKIVPGFSAEHLIINDREYTNPLRFLTSDKISKHICNLLCPKVFTSIHGDPTLQNIMQKDGNVWFIDPKARFGDIWLFGDPKQDFAKIYYSLVGNYDGLNAGNYVLQAGNEFNYSIPKHRFYVLGDWYLDHLSNKLGIEPAHIKLIHAILWVRTVGYDWTKSAEQAMMSFLHGTVLFNEAIKEI